MKLVFKLGTGEAARSLWLAEDVGISHFKTVIPFKFQQGTVKAFSKLID